MESNVTMCHHTPPTLTAMYRITTPVVTTTHTTAQTTRTTTIRPPAIARPTTTTIIAPLAHTIKLRITPMI